MDADRIIAELRSERNRIDQAIAALEGLTVDQAKSARQSAPPTAPRRRRRMSPAARKRMSAMMKARWASGKMGNVKRKTKAT